MYRSEMKELKAKFTNPTFLFVFGPKLEMAKV